ncbi:MAG: heterodisulfide reductase-related iron-sulfur binding cluster [Halobacteriota archaeon]
MTLDALISSRAKLPERLYLFKSCVAGTFYPGIERSFRYILNSLNVDYFDDPSQSSCTGFGVHCGVVPPQTNLCLNARNLTLASKSGYTNIICTCPTSYANLKECIDELRSASSRAAVNEVLTQVGLEYKGGLTVYHAAEVLYLIRDHLAERAKLSLSQLKIATHHGCHYTKVFYDQVIGGLWEYPHLLDDICASFSATLVDYSERSLCCGMGFSNLVSANDYTAVTSLRKLESILADEPDVIVTMCAGCQLILDRFQKRYEHRLGCTAPVLNVSQLVALLLGADKVKDACLQFGAINAVTIINKLEAV